MTYGDFKYLAKRTAPAKVFKIASNPKHYEYQRGVSSMVYNFFYEMSTSLADKSAAGSGIKNKITQN